ncbi:bifunctional diaminohydroxyphosphoribosylaminopyrimidine deaminase/5-amino-6-(5-phosphoribosylamino)uracil reductase RibD [Pedobacter duraquae]|uniref:Riboflavin biosynthesis protein RibD n=1 Tax=Pedobacter duraquae TaxID=425511 RepID=A0A4R6IEC1_9SPHI|nr:bifunctional diaminohydroxyphosphoribosylaminopyrimidine deaminase/5-amino-6-(5-phosphoribosylamino)uracil reductase RibD [Pedobacter duraquae]TDO20630.1 diaminohydroxyphosphoribosylaminopyrimidine deaminase [Pedobacter duraquae]
MLDETYMRRCLELAEMGMGNVSPNPMVGCVIVADGRIIGEGFHRKIGEAHAEVNAVKAVIDQYGDQAEDLFKRATVYVSLEPCAHFGKTPPCADLLIRHRVKKVVIGNKDPFSEVDGKGIEKLKNAGISVVQGVLEDSCTLLNRRFFTRVQQQRPYFILKWAQTANGFFAPLKRNKEWISSGMAKKLTHKWRTEEDAILVGKGTVLADNPQLNTREWTGKNPVRLVIDKNLDIPVSAAIFNSDAKTVIFNEIKTEVIDNIHYIQMEDMQFYLPQKIAYQLYLMDIQSVIIEGGAFMLSLFINAGLWDEARVFHSSHSWMTGIPAPEIHGFIEEVMNVDADRLLIYKNIKS